MRNPRAREYARAVAWFAALASGALVLACSGAAKVPAEPGGTPVTVTMTEFTIASVPTTVKAAELRFNVMNKGKQVHELVFIQTDLDEKNLPTLKATDKLPEGHAVGDVNEEAVESPGEIEDIDAGRAKDATFRLKPGHYVLLCNLAGHYASGMHTAFTVQ